MKKILLILITLTFVFNSLYAFSLTELEDKKVDLFVNLVENIVSRKWKEIRLKAIKLFKQLEKQNKIKNQRDSYIYKEVYKVLESINNYRSWTTLNYPDWYDWPLNISPLNIPKCTSNQHLKYSNPAGSATCENNEYYIENKKCVWSGSMWKWTFNCFDVKCNIELQTIIDGKCTCPNWYIEKCGWCIKEDEIPNPKNLKDRRSNVNCA